MMPVALKAPGSSGSADSDPSVPCRDQEEIPTFEEWTKIMMEVENEKSQITHVSNGLHAAGKKLQQTFTNYASVECGAKILSSNPEAKSTSAILMENMDMYMLNPCNNKIWLCTGFTFVSQLFVFLFSFLLHQMFTKYIKVELLSHFGSEHFCPLSLIRVFGTSMMEEYEMNSHEHPQVQDEHDYDQPPDFVPLEDKSSRNLIGSAKDALLTMVNNIAANVLGGHPETTAGAGNSSTEGLNMTEVFFPAESIHTAASSGSAGYHWITESASVTEDARSSSLTDASETRPAGDAPAKPRRRRADRHSAAPTPRTKRIFFSGGNPSERDPENEYICGWIELLLFTQSLSSGQTFCSAAPLQTLSEEEAKLNALTPVQPHEPYVRNRGHRGDGERPHSRSSPRPIQEIPAPSLTSDLLRLVSSDSLSSRATQPLRAEDASVCQRPPHGPRFPSSERVQRESPSWTLSDITSPSAAQSREDQVSSEQKDISTSVSPEYSRRASLWVHGHRNAKLHDAPRTKASNQKESVFMRLNNRIKVLEMNMSLRGRYLEQLSQRCMFHVLLPSKPHVSGSRQTDSIHLAGSREKYQLALSLSSPFFRRSKRAIFLLCLSLCSSGLLLCEHGRYQRSAVIHEIRFQTALIRCRSRPSTRLRKKHKVKLSKGARTCRVRRRFGDSSDRVGPLGLETGPHPDGPRPCGQNSEGSSQPTRPCSANRSCAVCVRRYRAPKTRTRAIPHQRGPTLTTSPSAPRTQRPPLGSGPTPNPL
ncbi:hypothetical protein QQF64_014264 [Cirrhinus molitorella]|uniref:SUN domain-containing protein n=1 Tax=Cirrhinus molitorella TaxID=172907 RepID=A0ABR3NRV2_9TELE